jgi:excisionase family DNA binding protein
LRDISSQTAADILGISRQNMVRLLDRGEIPSLRVGSHRRVRVDDLAIYRAPRDQSRRSALATLTADAQSAGGYDTPATFGPRRQG